MEYDSFEKFKEIASLPIRCPYFRSFFFFLRFLRKFNRPGHENLVLIISNFLVELLIKLQLKLATVLSCNYW